MLLVTDFCFFKNNFYFYSSTLFLIRKRNGLKFRSIHQTKELFLAANRLSSKRFKVESCRKLFPKTQQQTFYWFNKFDISDNTGFCND